MSVERAVLNSTEFTSAREEGLLLDRGGTYQAIVIGADSDFDRCYIVPRGQGAPRGVSVGASGTIDRQRDFAGGRAILVSVERPWIGEIQGPFNVLLPYARALGGTVTSLRLRPQDASAWLSGSVGNDIEFDLSLELHTCLPGWLPTKRAPLELPFRFPNFGSTGLSSAAINIPGYGRKSLSLSIEATGITAGGGSLDWNFNGRNYIDNIQSALQIGHDEALQAVTTETADFDRTYLFDGEFDVYNLSLSENAALGATTHITGLIKAWD